MSDGSGIVLDWGKFKPKLISELEKKIAELHQEIDKSKAENAQLKQELSFSDVIIQEYEVRVRSLKLELKELYAQQYRNLTAKNSSEINCCPPKHNERGAGRKSRADDKTIKLIKSYRKKGLSHRQIADKLTEITNEQWSKSTIGYILRKNDTSSK